jgi:hypothetical protein
LRVRRVIDRGREPATIEPIMDVLRAAGSASLAVCDNATTTPPRTAICFAGAARTFATPFMLESHRSMLVRPLVGEAHLERARAFAYLKLLDLRRTTEDLSSLAAALEGSSSWLRPILAEVAILNGSGSYAGRGFRPGLDAGSVWREAVFATDMRRGRVLQPNASRCQVRHTDEAWVRLLNGLNVATERALGLHWCGDAIVRDEQRTLAQFDAVAYERPDQLFVRALPAWCTWPWRTETLACQGGGNDGVWVAPRKDAMQAFNVIASHTRDACSNLSPSFQCHIAMPGGSVESNCPHHGRQLRSPLKPSCCGPQEFLLAQLLHDPRPLSVYNGSCTALKGISFNYLRRTELTSDDMEATAEANDGEVRSLCCGANSQPNHTCQVAMGLPYSHYFDNGGAVRTWLLHWFGEMQSRARLNAPTAQYLRRLYNAKKGAGPDKEAERRCRREMQAVELVRGVV